MNYFLGSMAILSWYPIVEIWGASQFELALWILSFFWTGLIPLIKAAAEQ